MKRILIAGMIAVVVVATIVAVRMYNKPHRTIDAKEADFSVSASHLIDAFSSDEEKANDEYVGRVLEVRGKVRERFRDGNTMVVVLGDSSHSAGVSFSFQQDNIDSAGFKKGQPVAIKGICNGMLFDVVMDKAVLIEKPSGGYN